MMDNWTNAAHHLMECKWMVARCCLPEGSYKMLEAVASARASGSTTLSLDLLDAETRSILRFAERNSEHRHRQPWAGRISSTSVVPEPSASRRKHRLHIF